jgi:invasion protein IalB
MATKPRRGTASYKLGVLAASLIWNTTLAYSRQDPTATSYGDWLVVCQPFDNGSKRCDLEQALTAPGAPLDTVIPIGIVRGTNPEPLKITIDLPVGTWLPSGAKIIAGDNTTLVSATYKFCNQYNCFADSELFDADIKSLRIQRDPGKLVYKSLAGGDISVPVSFNGFNEALDVVQKQ